MEGNTSVEMTKEDKVASLLKGLKDSENEIYYLNGKMERMNQELIQLTGKTWTEH